MSFATIKPTELQTIADLTAEVIGLSTKPKLLLKNIRGGGRAHIKSNTFTIPTWTFTVGDTYLIAYIVHEVCHFKYLGHGPDFKSLETEALRHWDLVPDYSRMKNYVSRILSTSGDVLYVRPKFL